MRKIEGREVQGRKYRHYALAVTTPDRPLPFPADMLRTEGCHPARQEDVQKMVRTPEGPTSVLLVRTTSRRDADWNLARWASFSWFLIPVEDAVSPLVVDLHRRKGLIEYLYQFEKHLGDLCGGHERLPPAGPYWSYAHSTFVQEVNPVQAADVYYDERVCKKARQAVTRS